MLALFPVRLNRLLVKNHHQDTDVLTISNVSSQETANAIRLLSHVRCRSKHTNYFNVNSQQLTSRMWY